MYLGSLVCSVLLIVFYVNAFASSLSSERDDRVAVSGHFTLPTATTLREEILEKSFKDSLVAIRRLVGSHPVQHCFLSYVNEDPDMLWMRRIESYLREVGVQLSISTLMAAAECSKNSTLKSFNFHFKLPCYFKFLTRLF